MGTKLRLLKTWKGENTWLNQVFFVLLLRDLEALKQNNTPSLLPPRKCSLQWLSILHQLVLALQNARGLLELICVTGVRFPCIGLRMGGGVLPLYPNTQVSSLTWFYCGRSCKKLSSTSARLLSASCLKFLGKAKLFSLSWVTHAPPSPWLGRWEPGLFLLLAAGRPVRMTNKSVYPHKEGPQLPSAGGGAVAVFFIGRKCRMFLWEKIIVLRLCPNWVESSRKEDKEYLGSCVWINFLTLQSFMEDSDCWNLQHFLQLSSNLWLWPAAQLPRIGPFSSMREILLL